MHIFPHTSLKTLAGKLLKDILSKDNFGANSAKGGFLTGGSVIVCESKGLQEYLQKECADKHGIWTALPFKPLAGLLMQCAYNLSPKDRKKDEKENIFNANNLVWAIYRFLEGPEKTFSFASEIASLFAAYQIYRPKLIEKWNKGEVYKIKNADENFKNNEKWQRELWLKLKKEYNELDVSQLYKLIESELAEKNFLPKQIFIFAPLSIAPIHLKTLTLIAKTGCKVNLYLHQISNEYIGDHLSDKKIANLRKKSWQENKIINETELYWDLGNRLIANLGRNAQTLYELILALNLEYSEIPLILANFDSGKSNATLLSKLQANIINDENEKTECEIDNSIILNNCFSPLREIEVLCDYILDLFVENKELTPADIAVVSPNIENYASAIESVFERNGIPYKIAGHDVKKSSKTAQLLNMLFAQIGSRYEAADIVSLFEYSMYVQGKELESSEIDRLEKWVRENAIRHGLESFDIPPPNYSFESGFKQLAAGFFMLSENEFSENNDYCYPDIEGNATKILGDFVCFVNTLREFEEASKKEKSIENWDYFFKEKFQIFFGTDEINFNEDKDNPYQKIINAWDSLKKEMLIGFNNNSSTLINFSALKSALPKKLESNAKSSYSLSGLLSFSNLESLRTFPHKVFCCVGMNSKEFPRQTKNKEISLIAEYEPGDKDTANEDRQIFLETILSAKQTLYISWVGQDEKNAEELEPSSVVIMLLKNLEEQYGIKTKNLITKHPLQPFSKKYCNGTLSTYDNRWLAANGQWLAASGKNIWEWKAAFEKTEEKKDIDSLYRILSDTPKYFLKTVCNIELPEEADLLENTEPFIVEKGLSEWELADLILKNEEDYNREIKIFKLRGKLPSGKFADKIIEKKIEEIHEMKKLEDKNVRTFIRPSDDKGKYRLWHWLKHLELNLTEAMDSDIILKTGKIRLPKLSKKEAQKEIEKLWELANELKTKMLPIFPNAAWEYLKTEKKIKAAEKIFFEYKYHSQYAKMLLGNAKAFKDLGVEREFIECSEKLFENYNGAEVKNANT
ncbi:MAG: exodeoxyribonuclease V subunit gamma [Fibromonadaceae bacterium]|jgi:exodeoxyribonuclease V gamma subunit|nr:exodeoxyribonuclease V subunit gamma [Fibromonadaceae bacterium]